MTIEILREETYTCGKQSEVISYCIVSDAGTLTDLAHEDLRELQQVLNSVLSEEGGSL